MAEDSKISWTDHTFNFWMGCSEVHEGCDNCYARKMVGEHYKKAQWGEQGTRVLTVPSNWRKVFTWDRKAEESGKPALVFCSSLSDVFEDFDGPLMNAKGEPLRYCGGWWCRRNGLGGRDDLPLPPIGPEKICPVCQTEGALLTMNAARTLLFNALIDATPHLWWLVLTKRPGNVDAMLPVPWEGCREWNRRGEDLRYRGNVLLGTSPAADTAAHPLPQQLAAVRHLARGTFWSVEPLLHDPQDSDMVDLLGLVRNGGQFKPCQHDLDGPLVDWIIGGGETKAGSRPWPIWGARHLRDMAKAAGVPFHWKQNGDWLPLTIESPCIVWDERNRPIMAKVDGRTYTGADLRWEDATVYVRVGEKRSGRMLDGVLHDAFPDFVEQFPEAADVVSAA